jgi:hypothetical protein
MDRKINDQIKKSLKKERNTHYVFSQDFFNEVGGITENEDELAQRFMSLIGSNKHYAEEIMLIVEPQQLYHFFVRLQREILLGK